MIKVTVTPAPRGRLTVTGEKDGRTFYEDTITKSNKGQREKAARELGVPADWLLDTLATTEPRTWEPPPPPAAGGAGSDGAVCAGSLFRATRSAGSSVIGYSVTPISRPPASQDITRSADRSTR